MQINDNRDSGLHQLLSVLVLLSVGFLYSEICLGGWIVEGSKESPDKSLVLNYIIEDGYKINIWINTRAKEKVFSEVLMADVNDIDARFADINNDGLVDIFVRFRDETGYVPRLFLNMGEDKFVKGFEGMRENLYVNTEQEPERDDSKEANLGYSVILAEGITDTKLIFYNVFINGKGYRTITLKYAVEDKRYIVSERGVVFVNRSKK